MSGIRDNAGRYRSGTPSPNPKGRPKKARGVDAAVLGALSKKVTVTEQGRRKSKSILDITATQVANKGAGGDLRAAKMTFDEARKAEARAEAESVRAPVMTRGDHEVAARVIARLAAILASPQNENSNSSSNKGDTQ